MGWNEDLMNEGTNYAWAVDEDGWLEASFEEQFEPEIYGPDELDAWYDDDYTADYVDDRADAEAHMDW